MATFAITGKHFRVYREEESRYKADCKQLTRARRIIAAKIKNQPSA